MYLSVTVKIMLILVFFLFSQKLLTHCNVLQKLLKWSCIFWGGGFIVLKLFKLVICPDPIIL